MAVRWKPSVTVAAVVERVDADARRFLVVEEETSEGLRINNPAGHLEAGESPQSAVVREVLEETGCAFEPAALVGVYLSRVVRPATGEDVTYLRLAFSGTVGAPEPGRALDAGIVRAAWLTVDELRACRERHRSPHVMAGVLDHLAGRRLPLDAITTDATVFAHGP